MNIACPECTTVYRVDPDRIPADGVAAACRECGTAFLVDDTLAPTAPGDTVVAPRVEGGAVEEPTGASGPEPGGDSEPGEPDGTEGTEAVDDTEAPASPDETEAGEAAVAEQGSETIRTPGDGQEPEPAEEPQAEEHSQAVEDTDGLGEIGATEETGGEEETGAEEEAGAVQSAADDEAAEGADPVDGSETEGTESEEGAPAFGPQDPETRARRLARALVSDIKVYHPDRWEEARAEGTLRADFRDEILKSWDEYVEQVGEKMAKSTPFFRDALNEILAQGEHVF